MNHTQSNCSMITFAVFRNRELVCRAGADGLGVLSSIITWASRESAEEPNAEELELTVGGLMSLGPERGTHVNWARLDLRRGDEISVQISDGIVVDEPIEKSPPEEINEVLLASKQEYVRRMCKEFGWSIVEGGT